MKLFNSDYFTYKNNELYCEDVRIKDITDNVDTPVYIYSKRFFEDRYNEFTNAYKEIKHRVFFASKANYNIHVEKLFDEMGCGIDVNSGGELLRALEAGVKPENMLLTGVGKTDEEIKMGLEHGVLLVKAESLEEVHVINDIAKQLGKTAKVAFRVNPDVDPQTHPYISTGLAENKFGIDSTVAVDIYLEASRLSNIEICGIDMHIGSQITKIAPYVESVKKMADLIKVLKSNGLNIEHFDLGGGMGIVYNEETPFTPSELAEAIIPVLKETGCEIFFEPGRSLTANGGVLITNVLYTKKNNLKNFIVIDASMTDLLRPSIYGAYHHIQPVELIEGREDLKADVVGPVCESGDFLAKDRLLTATKRGELLAVMSAGAYGIVMASNYNGRRKPAEVLVEKNAFRVIRKRDSYKQLIENEL